LDKEKVTETVERLTTLTVELLVGVVIRRIESDLCHLMVTCS